jgi:hypothetical protein
MPDLPISQLPETTTPNGSDVFPIVDQGTTKKLALSDLLKYISNNMKIGNYPYLEYGWVCAPNTAPQAIASNTNTKLKINTEVADINSYGSIDAVNYQLRVVGGTYTFEITTAVGYQGAVSPSDSVILSLYNASTSSYITRSRFIYNYYGTIGFNAMLNGQFTVDTSTLLEIYALTGRGSYIGTVDSSNPFTGTNPLDDQRTTIKLWKVG